MKLTKFNFKKLQTICLIYLLLIILLVIVIVYLLSKKSCDLKIPNKMVKDKFDSLVKVIGNPTYVDKCSSNNLNIATWMSPLNKFHDFGKFGGCDLVKIHGKPSKKYHPYPAILFLIVGKYMKVPEHLLGPIKHASETINIEQLFVPQKYAEKYYKTGEKEIALVTGSCASVTISAITVQFVADMIKQYQEQTECLALYDTFRNEYDRRITDYLCGKGITNPIPWFDPKFWGEPEIYNIGNDKCNRKKNNNNKNSNKKNYNNKTVYQNKLKLGYDSSNNGGGLKAVVNHFVSPRSHEPG